MKNKKRIEIRALLAIALSVACVSMAACGGGAAAEPAVSQEPAAQAPAAEPAAPPAEPEPSAEVITIAYPTYRVGAHLSAKAESIILDEFNRQFGDRIQVAVEELPSDQAYVEKMKVLAASNALPDVVEGKDGVLDLAIKNGQAIELSKYLDADAAYKSVIGDGAIAANTRDGNLYSISNGNQQIGYFYNRDHFAAAGITPAKTWDAFMENCEKLKQAGVMPISMMTGENCWTTNLLLASIIGTSPAGNQFMRTQYPSNYETPEIISALDRIGTILAKYTTQDALGAGYATAANHFLQGNTAMIANGPWMVGDFTDPEKAIAGLNVGVAMYPENGLFAQYEIGYMVCSPDPALQDAAFEFVKFKTGEFAQSVMLEHSGTIPLTANVPIPDEYKAENPLVAELLELSADAKYQYGTLDNISYASVIEEMSKTYPSLSMGDITAADMAKALTEAAGRSQ